MSRLWAFLVRDYLIATSYRTSFAVQSVAALLWVPALYWLGHGAGALRPRIEEETGQDLFAFLLLGVGLLGYFSISLKTFHRSVRDSQLMGTLEIVLLSPTRLTQLVFFPAAWIYLFTTLRFLLFLGAGVLFGLDLGRGDPILGAAVLLLAIPAFASLGIASAALVLLVKRGESIGTLLSTGSLVLGGVLVPVSDLPGWLQPLSALLPITHALEAMRAALLSDAGWSAVAPDLATLAAFDVVLLPLSLLAFSKALEVAKARGTLTHY